MKKKEKEEDVFQKQNLTTTNQKLEKTPPSSSQ
jgi:hypothetical protein